MIDIALTSVVIHSKFSTIRACLKLSLKVLACDFILSFKGLIFDAKKLDHLRGPEKLVICHLVAESLKIFDKRDHLLRVLACWATCERG